MELALTGPSVRMALEYVGNVESSEKLEDTATIDGTISIDSRVFFF
jgi:hypothetical protein